MGARDPRFPLFDSLRAIAALSVLAFHVTFLLTLFDGASLSRWYRELNVGVPVFFVISGFLLYRPFTRARAAGDPTPRIGAYAARRVARIAPAYWAMLLLASLMLGLSSVLSPDGFAKYFFFLQIYDADASSLPRGIGHTWTLCVEVAFYAFLPLWAFAMRHVRRELVPLALLFLFSIAWRAATIRYVEPTDGAFWPLLLSLPAYLDLFAVGMALAVVSVAVSGRDERPAAVRLIERAPWLPWTAAFGVFVALGLDHRSFGPGLASQQVVHQELQGLVAVGLVLPAIFGEARRGLVRRFLGSPLMLWLGLISYGLYLWHLPVLAQLYEWDLQDDVGKLGFAAVGLAASIAAAAASWYLLERHVIAFVRRRTSRAPA